MHILTLVFFCVQSTTNFTSIMPLQLPALTTRGFSWPPAKMDARNGRTMVSCELLLPIGDVLLVSLTIYQHVKFV